MIADTFTLAFCISVAVLSIISILMNPFLRRIQPKAGTDSEPETGTVPVSVLVLSDDNAEALEAHLPVLLAQDYPAGYEVIVVLKQGDVPTECVVKKYSGNTNLRTTFIPAKSLFMSARKLAVTLGVKAARHEWIVLLDAESSPLSHRWLATLSSHFDDNSDIVMGYSNYETESKTRWRFYRLRTAYYLMHKALNGCAYRCSGTNLAFRRQMFIDGEGYKGNLQYVNGEYDFLVNKYSSPFRTRMATSCEAAVREDRPTNKTYRTRELAYLHLRHSMIHGKGLRLLFNTDLALMWADYIILAAAIVIASLSQNWILLATAAVFLIVTLIARVYAAGKAVERFGEDIPKWKIPFLELSIVGHNVGNLMRYAKADKRDFSTHKL